jgi:aminoglycoside 2'-N-acetyltransferase I
MRTAHTADVDAATLAAARMLLDEAFAGDFGGDDWDHTLGGIHALAYEGGELVGHASVVQRRLLTQGRALRTGYVKGVGVAPHARRRGHGDAIMNALGRVIRGAYDLGALGATDEGAQVCRRHGWRRWGGTALRPRAGRHRPHARRMGTSTCQKARCRSTAPPR